MIMMMMTTMTIATDQYFSDGLKPQKLCHLSLKPAIGRAGFFSSNP